MEQRTPLIAGNWKMFKTGAEGADYLRRLAALLSCGTGGVEVMIAPPFTALAAAAAVLQDGAIALGAQNLHFEKQGAFTGEISAPMLAAAGCRFAIVGHSERRHIFGESDADVQRKIAAALDAGLAPVLCVGETEAQRDAGQTFSVLDRQVESALKGLVPERLGGLVIAYEPVWAIGTGRTATSAQAQEAHAHIRGRIAAGVELALSKTLRILYGGSVKAENIAELMAMPDVDGALVGGASLDPESFSRIVLYRRAGETR
jgi:triosephosphate isomerase